MLSLIAFIVLLGSAVVVQAQLRNGDQVCTEGYIMDAYCIQIGYMLDNGLDPLRFPEEHTVHCLVDVGVCRNSGFVVLIDPEEGEDEYTQGYRLDSEGNEAITQLARAVGSCSTCYPTGTVVSGMRAGIMGTVVDASSVPPTITVEKASYIEPGEVYCPEVPPTNRPTLTPSASPTVSPIAFPSAVPSALPTTAPTALPTETMTALPSATPSASPTTSPFAMPSVPPSAPPSVTPISFPSVAPSVPPSASPLFSVSDSDYPSIVPSDAPSIMPSDVPSLMPSNVPSLIPSEMPSDGFPQ